ncbi:MAG TPA: GntR family transcriptional regulator [Ramlibacter sp.]|nr:GntR family transcriptional regulator [Ramlibacter sp.]
MVQQSSVLPLYAQIKEALRAKIIDGTYSAHARLPSESEMIRAFGVSRITVRQALNDLQKEGLLFKVHGKGTYVSKPKVAQELTHLQGFGEAMNRLGHETFSQVQTFEQVVGVAEICARLLLPPGAPLLEMRRIRYLDREPISVDHSYLPASIGARLSQASLRDRDLFSLLENELGHRLHSADVEIDATLATPELARNLRVANKAPVLRIERLTYATESRPLVYEHLHYRADKFKYKLKITR